MVAAVSVTSGTGPCIAYEKGTRGRCFRRTATATEAACAAARRCAPESSAGCLARPARSLMPRMTRVGTWSCSCDTWTAPELSISMAAASS
jgi:hypothetical protein